MGVSFLACQMERLTLYQLTIHKISYNLEVIGGLTIHLFNFPATKIK